MQGIQRTYIFDFLLSFPRLFFAIGVYYFKIPLITWKFLEFRHPTNGGKKEPQDASRKRQ